MLDSLESRCIRPRSLERAFDKMAVEEKMKPGRYVIKPSYTSIYVARMLVFGWQTPQNLTLSGTIRKKDVLARKIAAQMMVDSASVANALESTAFLAEYGFTPENTFAMVLLRHASMLSSLRTFTSTSISVQALILTEHIVLQ